MDCFSCQQPYNRERRCPRLLIQCGHSLCETCLLTKFSNRTIVCPECYATNYAESVDAMPKNIALLNFNRTGSIVNSSQPTTTAATIALSDRTQLITHNPIPASKSQEDEKDCIKHEKNYEAFCVNDKSLMCIGCILEDDHRRKNHTLDSIESSVASERQFVEKEMHRLENLCLKLSDLIRKHQEINAHLLRDSATAATFHREQIAALMSYIKSTVDQLETDLLGRLSQLIGNQQKQISESQGNLENLLVTIEGKVSQAAELLESKSAIGLLGGLNKFWEHTIDEQSLKIPPLQSPPSAVFSNDMQKEVQNFAKMISQELSSRVVASPPQTQSVAVVSNSSKSAVVSSARVAKTAPSQSAASCLVTSQVKSSRLAGQKKEVPIVAIKNNTNIAKDQNIAKKLSNSPVLSLTAKQVTQQKLQLKKQAFQNGFNSSNTKVARRYTENFDDEKGIINVLNSSNIQPTLQNQKTQQQQYQQQPLQQQGSILTKPLNNYQDLRTMMKEKRSFVEGDKASIDVLKISHEDDTVNKHQRSPVSMIQLSNQNSFILPSSSTRSIKVPLQGQQAMVQHASVSQRYSKTNVESDGNSFSQSQLAISSQFSSPDYTQQQYFSQPSRNDPVLQSYSSVQYEAASKQEAFQMPEQYKSIEIIPTSRIQTTTDIPSNKSTSNSNLAYVPQSFDLPRFSYDFSGLQNSISVTPTQDLVYLIGGRSEGQVTSIDQFNTASRSWEVSAILPAQNRRQFSAVYQPSSNRIVVIGGIVGDKRVSTIEEYNPQSKQFTTTSLALTSPRSSFGAVCKYGVMTIVGGSDGMGALDLVESYDVLMQQQRTLAPMLEKREELAVVLGKDGHIYALGGASINNTALNSVERYNTILNQWDKIASMNTPRRSLSAVSASGGIFAIGGINNTTILDSVERYDANLNCWFVMSSMKIGRCSFSAVSSSDGNSIYVFGGFNNYSLASIERYDITNGAWESYGDMGSTRSMHCGLIATTGGYHM